MKKITIWTKEKINKFIFSEIFYFFLLEHNQTTLMNTDLCLNSSIEGKITFTCKVPKLAITFTETLEVAKIIVKGLSNLKLQWTRYFDLYEALAHETEKMNKTISPEHAIYLQTKKASTKYAHPTSNKILTACYYFLRRLSAYLYLPADRMTFEGFVYLLYYKSEAHDWAYVGQTTEGFDNRMLRHACEFLLGYKQPLFECMRRIGGEKGFTYFKVVTLHQSNSITRKKLEELEKTTIQEMPIDCCLNIRHVSKEKYRDKCVLRRLMLAYPTDEEIKKEKNQEQQRLEYPDTMEELKERQITEKLSDIGVNIQYEKLYRKRKQKEIEYENGRKLWFDRMNAKKIETEKKEMKEIEFYTTSSLEEKNDDDDDGEIRRLKKKLKVQKHK